ncbi:MAG: hypothetical protein JWM47_1658 [Acidimicrobiales bacterium]|nr:hypothetical protein [Acidimicrobiales bacterium]
MAPRHEDLTPDQVERQKAYEQSWESAQRQLADPERRAYLKARIERLNAQPRGPDLTAQVLLAECERLRK